MGWFLQWIHVILRRHFWFWILVVVVVVVVGIVSISVVATGIVVYILDLSNVNFDEVIF